MAKQNISFELDGEPGGTPANLEGINLSAKWGTRDGQEESEISTDSIEFVLEDAKKLIQHVNGGLSGGVGIFEGVPYKIDLNGQNIFNGYVDLSDDAEFIENEKVIANIVKQGGVDWLNDIADGISFGALRQLGFIKDSDYVSVPYVLNYRPEAFILGQLSIAIYLLQKELIQSIKDTADRTADVIEAATPSISAVGPVYNIGKIITTSLLLTAQIVYSTAIVIALVRTITDLVNQFFPPIRRYRAMTVKRMFETGLSFFGLDFKSTIFDSGDWSKTVYLPNKSERGGILGSTDSFGHPNQKSPIYNFGDFIRTMIEVFNADFRIDGETFIFERRDYWDSLSTYVLPNVETNQSARLSELQYNTSEFVKNYFISFQTDVQDQNTLENFIGTNYQIISEPVVVNKSKMIAGKGLAQIRPPFALGTRKNELTVYEKTLNLLCKLTDTVVNLLGGRSKLSSIISDRVGMMQLSDDTIGVDKLLFMSGENMETVQPTAKNLWESFHFIESFAEINDSKTGEIVHNQHIIRNAEKVPFCLSDWNELLGNNKFITEDGKEGEILSIDWNFQNGFANIQYKIKQLYTKNVKLVFNEGQ
jgi:hypothetical protein